ncbi:MAG: mechanosensitive ion channel [Alphaproteobacteria bacterium]|nr:mechanosensitive ion channel [Alphaproteobacteria bacterium]
MTEYFKEYPMLLSFSSFALVLLIALVANFFVKKFLMKLFEKIVKFAKQGNEAEVIRIVARLSNIIPAIIVTKGVTLVPHIPTYFVTIVKNVGNAFVVATFAIALNLILDVVNSVYMRRPDAKDKPIKGYLQVVKLIVSVLACILVLATLIDKSPTILLSSLGAMAAVTMLVFQDTILSLVASVQISSSDIIKLGDWVEMPQQGADGDVIDIALHTVKIQNWDKTITTVPTRKFVTDAFKNWRGMRESGGRRIKRAIYLDQNSIHFLSADEEKHLKNFALLKDYLAGKDKELEAWNNQNQAEIPLNARRLTNIGTFRAYVQKYLESHPKVKKNMALMVRQLAPSSKGLPLEIYCFTDTIVWVEYEGIQSDIFDHIYAIMPEFNLAVFQEPQGRDFQLFASNK